MEPSDSNESKPLTSNSTNAKRLTPLRLVLLGTAVIVVVALFSIINRDITKAPVTRVQNRSSVRKHEDHQHDGLEGHSQQVQRTQVHSQQLTSDFDEAIAAFDQIPMKLWNVSLFYCLNNVNAHRDVGWRDLTDEQAFGGRWRCFCLEEHPADYNNCFSRFSNATVYRSYQSPETREKTIILLDNVGFAVNGLHVDSSQEPWTAHNVVLHTTTPCREGETPSHSRWVGNVSIPSCGTIQPNLTTTAPYSTPFNFSESPVLLAPVLTVQQNHYHSIAGPSGVLQYTITVNAINKYFYDLDVAKRHSKEGITNSPLASNETIPRLIRGPRMSYNSEYTFDPNSPRVDISNRGSCSIMNFSSSDDADYGWLGNSSMPSGLAPVLANHTLRPSYLSREILVGFDMATRVPKTLGTNGWFGRREGYCSLDLPHESYSIVGDLWINLIGKHLTTQWLLRRPRDHERPELADIVTADEFFNYCPLLNEETIAGRWSVERMVSIWSSFAPSLAPPSYESNNEPHEASLIATRECMQVTKPPTIPGGKAATLCVLAIGRNLHFDHHRQRGLPPHVEKIIVTALVMPLDGPGITPLDRTSEAEMRSVQWWQWDNATRSRRCETIVPDAADGCPREKAAILAMPRDDSTAKGLLEQLNLDAGLQACATPSLSPAFYYDCVKFPTTSPFYNASNLLRTNFDSIPIVEQFAQIRAANVFVFEEGAPLTWALAAKEGSTFICVFNSNYMRYQGDKGRWKTVRKEVKVGDKTEIVETLEPARHNGGFSPQTEFFVTTPHLVGKVRLILVIYQYSRWPSMAKLREVFDLPFSPETYVVACECDHTRVLPYSLVKPNCTSAKSHG